MWLVWYLPRPTNIGIGVYLANLSDNDLETFGEGNGLAKVYVSFGKKRCVTYTRFL